MVQQKENASFTINSSAPIVPEGEAATISGIQYLAGSSSRPQASTQVTLYGRQAGGESEALSTTVTGLDGSYSFSQSPVHSTVYYVAATLNAKRRSAALFEGIQDELTIAASSATATVGGSTTLSGTVTPDKTGHKVSLQRLGTDGNWHNVAIGTVTTGSTYSFTYSFGQAGSVQVRARIDGGPDNVGGASAPESITVSGVAPISRLPPAL